MLISHDLCLGNRDESGRRRRRHFTEGLDDPRAAFADAGFADVPTVRPPRHGSIP